MNNDDFKTLHFDYLDGHVLKIAFDHSTALETVTFKSADHAEALNALKEKRAPDFKGV